MWSFELLARACTVMLACFILSAGCTRAHTLSWTLCSLVFIAFATELFARLCFCVYVLFDLPHWSLLSLHFAMLLSEFYNMYCLSAFLPVNVALGVFKRRELQWMGSLRIRRYFILLCSFLRRSREQAWVYWASLLMLLCLRCIAIGAWNAFSQTNQTPL